jgi:hypothetical protein
MFLSSQSSPIEKLPLHQIESGADSSPDLSVYVMADK